MFYIKKIKEDMLNDLKSDGLEPSLTDQHQYLSVLRESVDHEDRSSFKKTLLLFELDRELFRLEQQIIFPK